MAKLRHEIIGKNGGNFRLATVDEPIFLANLRHQTSKRRIGQTFSPHCRLTTEISDSTSLDQIIKVTPWFIRSPEGRDGFLVASRSTAISIFNADCPVVVLFHEYYGCLGLLHAGFRCLVPENGLSIIPKFFQKFDFIPAHSVKAFVGFGAGPCCYGAEHLPETAHPRFQAFTSTATNGPRAGQRSLDLSEIAKWQLLKCGVRDKSITLDRRCTACAGRENGGAGDYYSNIYEGSDTGRNLVLAWFT